MHKPLGPIAITGDNAHAADLSPSAKRAYILAVLQMADKADATVTVGDCEFMAASYTDRTDDLRAALVALEKIGAFSRPLTDDYYSLQVLQWQNTGTKLRVEMHEQEYLRIRNRIYADLPVATTRALNTVVEYKQAKLDQSKWRAAMVDRLAKDAPLEHKVASVLGGLAEKAEKTMVAEIEETEAYLRAQL